MTTTYSLDIAISLPLVGDVVMLSVNRMHEREDIETLLCMFGNAEMPGEQKLEVWANLITHNDPETPGINQP